MGCAMTAKWQYRKAYEATVEEVRTLRDSVSRLSESRNNMLEEYLRLESENEKLREENSNLRWYVEYLERAEMGRATRDKLEEVKANLNHRRWKCDLEEKW